MSRRNSKNSRNGRRRRQRGAGRPSVPDQAVGYLCGMFDPFCKHSLSAKVPSESSHRSVSANIADFATITASQDATTLDYYMSRRYGVGLDLPLGTAVMNNSVTSSASAVNSSWYSLSDIETYRVVAAAVRFRYTGPPLSASGFFRIYKVASGDHITVATAKSWPDSLSDLTGLYWDFSPSELAKGVTVFLNKSNPLAETYIDIDDVEQREAHEACQIFGVGLESGATVTAELRQTIEFVPVANTTGALVATINHPKIPAIQHAHSKLTGAIHVAVGNAKQVGSQVYNHAKASLWDTLKQAGSSIFTQGISALGNHLQENASGFIDAITQGLPMLL
jgi:hypothetical protein